MSTASSVHLVETELSITCLSGLEEGDTVELGVATHACNISSDGVRLEDVPLPRECQVAGFSTLL